VAHPEGLVPEGEESVRLFHRRASAELWPLIATVAGAGYAFDFDPDGAYSDEDRAMRKLVEGLPWEDRAAELRLAGVTHVVVDRLLPPPYREVRQLRPNEVWLYGLEGAAPSLRWATRIVSVRTLAEVVAYHRSPAFDATTDAVVVGSNPYSGDPVAATPERLAEGVGFVWARVSSPRQGLLVWSRTYFRAWRATVDGTAVEPVLTDGHLVGVPVPAGDHVVEVHWSKGPVLLGGVLAGIGLILALALALVRGGRGL
jgi:hypothetical protein